MRRSSECPALQNDKIKNGEWQRGDGRLLVLSPSFPSSCFRLESCVEILMKCDKFPAAASILGPGFRRERGKVLTYVEEAAGRLCRTSGPYLLMLTHLFTVSLFDLSAEDTDNTRWASLPACTSCSCMCVCVTHFVILFFFVPAHRSPLFMPTICLTYTRQSSMPSPSCAVVSPQKPDS